MGSRDGGVGFEEGFKVLYFDGGVDVDRESAIVFCDHGDHLWQNGDG